MRKPSWRRQNRARLPPGQNAKLQKSMALSQKHIWLVHKTRRDVLQWVLSEGLKPGHSFLRKPSWHLVNRVFDSVRPRAMRISRFKVNYFCTREIVEAELAKESFLYSSDMLGWFNPKQIQAMDWTRVKARVDARKARVFDEGIVDGAIKQVEEFHEKVGKPIDSSAPEALPKELLARIQEAGQRYWRSWMSYTDFKRYYSFDPQKMAIRKKPNAPAKLPETIQRVEILYPGKVPQVNVREVKDWYNERLKEIRRNAGIEK